LYFQPVVAERSDLLHAVLSTSPTAPHASNKNLFMILTLFKRSTNIVFYYFCVIMS
jgi:hypothetical protein